MYRAIQRLILLAVGITLPMEGLAATVAGYPLTPAKGAIVLLLVLVGMQFALSSQRVFPRDRAIVPLVIFTVSLAISSVVSLADGMKLWVVLASASRFVGLVFFYAMLVYVVRTRDDLALIFWALLIGGAITAVPALLEIRSGSFLASGMRSEGLAGQANSLGYELAICLSVAFALYFTTKSRFRQLFILGCVSLMFVAIFGSLSRSAFLSLGVMWAFWIWRSRRLDTLKYVIPGLAVAMVLFFLMPQRVHERISTMVDPSAREQDTSIQGRFEMVIWTGRAMAQSPLVGVGVNNYVPWVRRQPGGGTIYNTLHSGYMSILVDQGLLGFLPFMAMILLAWMDYGAAQALARARRNRGDPGIRELGSYALFLQIALLGCMVGALTHDRSESKGWWMVMGLSASVVTLVRRRNAELLAQTPASATEPPGWAGLPYGSEVASARR